MGAYGWENGAARKLVKPARKSGKAMLVKAQLVSLRVGLATPKNRRRGRARKPPTVKAMVVVQQTIHPPKNLLVLLQKPPRTPSTSLAATVSAFTDPKT